MKNSNKFTKIDKHSLRALLAWATWGIRHSRGGMYGIDIESIIKTCAAKIKYKIDPEPIIGEDLYKEK